MIGTLRDKLLAKLQSKKYRDAYVAAEVTTGIAYQIRALREQRHWTQEALGQRLGKGQNAVSRVEDPDYGRLSVKTLTELAAAFDVAVLVKFVPFTKFFIETSDKSPQGLEAVGFCEELPMLRSLVVNELGSSEVKAEDDICITRIATGSVLPGASIFPFPLRKKALSIQDVPMETTDLSHLPNLANVVNS